MRHALLGDANDAADYVVTRCAVAGHPIPALTLSRMLYVLYRQVIRQSVGTCLLFDDLFMATIYGPVIPSVIERYPLHVSTPLMDTGSVAHIRRIRDDLDGLCPYVDDVIDDLATRRSSDLVTVVCAADGPWDRIWGRGTGDGKPLPVDDIVADVLCRTPAPAGVTCPKCHTPLTGVMRVLGSRYVRWCPCCGYHLGRDQIGGTVR